MNILKAPWKRKVGKLMNLRIDRVDLVDKGANEHAHVVLTNREQKGHFMDPQTLVTHVKGIHSHLDQMLEAHKAADGMIDHLPSEHLIHRHLHGILRKIAGIYGYQRHAHRRRQRRRGAGDRH